MSFWLEILISAVAVYITASILPGVSVKSFWTALIVALVLAFLNAFLRPVLEFLSIPFTIITFGLFLIVINTVIILIASALIDGFKVNGFWWALLFGLILSLVTSVMDRILF